MSDTFSFTGQDNIFRNLANIADKATKNAAVKALMYEGNAIMNESKKMCPVFNNILLPSGAVGWALNPYPHVVLYYTTAYAIYVHERVCRHYNKPGSSHHYLSIPLNNARRGFLERLGKRFWDLLWASSVKAA